MDEHEVERAVMTESMLLQSRLLGIQRQVASRSTFPAGECENCGGRIPPERIRALPNAFRCVDCQGQMERGR